MQIITTATNKGGTGKTTTAAALAQAAAADGKKVLAVDLDPQGNLSFVLAADANRPGSFHLLNGAPVLDVIQRTPQGLDVIAASPDLIAEKTKPNSAERLAKALEPLKGKYSYVFVDTPPTLGELTFNALRASTGLIVPLEADTNSLQGLYMVLDLARQMKAHNPKLKVLGTVLTRYDNRPNLNKYLKGVIEEQGKEAGAPLLGTIRPGVAIKEAQALQRSLFEYAPKSNPAADYEALYKTIRR